MTKTNEKYNTSCIKIFELLKLLLNDEAEYETVIKLFSDECSGINSNPNVILNKYLNTLKIFGIKVKKIKNRYHLLHTPITIDFDEEDLKCLNSIKKFMDIFPDGKNKEECSKFISSLEVRFDDKSKTKFEGINTHKSYDYSLYFSKYAEQITICEKYVQDKQKLQMTYVDKSGEHQILCLPKDLNYKDKKINFTVITTGRWTFLEIPVDNIINMYQFPTKSSSDMKYSTTVAFRIKDRLAKNYSLRSCEHIDREEENAKVIINCGEDLNLLLKRLMRYDTQCEIISPKFLKEDMKKLIENSLANYE